MKTLTVEIYEDGIIYIGEDGASGSEYEGTTPADVGYAVECYLEDNQEEV